MDDCNVAAPAPTVAPPQVQIPLWTIVTMQQYIVKGFFTSSDSSMDDCNVHRRAASDADEEFRFLYGRL